MIHAEKSRRRRDLCELSWLYLMFPSALPLVPLTRFPGFVWTIAMGRDRTRFARTLFIRQRAEMSEVSGKRLLVAVAASAGLGVASGVSTAYGLPALSPAWGDTDRLATVIVLEAYLAIIVGHMVAFGGFEALRSRLRIAPTSSREFVAAAAVWIAIWAAAAVLYLVLSSFAWPLRDVASALLWIGADGGRLADAEPLLFVLAAGRALVIAPFAEELLFRGSLFGWLRGRLPAFATILITASVFALGHPMPVLWPAAWLFGMGSAWFRERCGSVTPFILVHVINNLVLTAISYWVTGWYVPNPFDPAVATP